MLVLIYLIRSKLDIMILTNLKFNVRKN